MPAVQMPIVGNYGNVEAKSGPEVIFFGTHSVDTTKRSEIV